MYIYKSLSNCVFHRRSIVLHNPLRMNNGTGATVNTEDNDEDERYFQNPTYGEGGPSTNNISDTTTIGTAAMYATVDDLSRRTRPTAVTTEDSRQQDSNGTTKFRRKN